MQSSQVKEGDEFILPLRGWRSRELKHLPVLTQLVKRKGNQNLHLPIILSCSVLTTNQYFFLKILFIYLTEREIARAGTQARGVGEGEVGFPWSREPDAWLDPGTLGS